MRTLLVGCGNHGGDTLLPAALSADIDIIGLVDHDRRRRHELSQRWKISDGFDSVDQVPTSGYDSVIIALPVAQQAVHVSWAFEHGLHVFVEKPPAAHLAELRSLIKEQDSTGLVCRVGMNFRYAAGVRALLEVIRSGKHGGAQYVRVTQIARKPIVPFSAELTLEASLFHAQGVHAIDLGMLLVPAAMTISGQCVRVTRGSLCVVVGEEPNGGGRFEASFGSCGASLYHQLDVFFETGDMFSLRDLSELIHLPHGAAEEVTSYPGARIVWRRSPTNAGFDTAGYAAELAAFRDEVVVGSTVDASAPPSLVDMLAVYEAFDTVLNSRRLRWTS
jgi:predicted dehydrogenase